MLKGGCILKARDSEHEATNHNQYLEQGLNQQADANFLHNLGQYYWNKRSGLDRISMAERASVTVKVSYS